MPQFYKGGKDGINLVSILFKAAIPEVYLIVRQDCKLYSTIACPILQPGNETSVHLKKDCM